MTQIKNSATESCDYDLSATGCETTSGTGLRKTQYNDKTLFTNSAYHIKNTNRKQQTFSQLNDPITSLVSVKFLYI